MSNEMRACIDLILGLCFTGKTNSGYGRDYNRTERFMRNGTLSFVVFSHEDSELSYNSANFGGEVACKVLC
jgi:hypothetical protein